MLHRAAGSIEAIQADFEQQFNLPLVRVGAIQHGEGVTLAQPDGSAAILPSRGYDHFRPAP